MRQGQIVLILPEAVLTFQPKRDQTQWELIPLRELGPQNQSCEISE